MSWDDGLSEQKGNQHRIKALLVDSETISRQAIQAALASRQTEIHVVGEAETGRQGIEMAMKLEPDIVVTEVALALVHGIELTKKIRLQRPKTKVLILSRYSDDEVIKEALDAGAIGYALKNISTEELVEAIRGASRGKSWFSPSITSALVDDYRARGLPLTPSKLVVYSARSHLYFKKGPTAPELSQDDLLEHEDPVEEVEETSDQTLTLSERARRAVHLHKVRLLVSIVRNDRKAVHVSRENLAVKAGVSAEALRHFEVGTSVPTNELLMAVANVLGQPPLKYVEIKEALALDPGDVNERSLERTIEFQPNHRQAGIAILSQFSEILNREYPDENVAVNIIQSGNYVTLRIVRPSGRIDEIERRLDDYGMVVLGKMPIEEFSKDKELIRELKMRLEITAMELRLKNDMFLEQRAEHQNRIQSLEGQVAALHSIVAAGLTQSTSLVQVLQSIEHKTSISDSVFSDLLHIIAMSRSSGVTCNEAELRSALEKIRQSEPTFYQRMVNELAAIPSTVVANLATPWVQTILNALPK